MISHTVCPLRSFFMQDVADSNGTTYPGKNQLPREESDSWERSVTQIGS